MAQIFLTTIDNPFDYFEQFDEWNAFDTQKGYNTLSYLARIAKTSTEMTEKEYENIVNEAVEEALRLNITGLYKKAIKKEAKEDIKRDREEDLRG